MNAQSSLLARLLTVLVIVACVMSDGPVNAQTARRTVPAAKIKKYATAGVIELGGSASFEMRTAVVAGTTASNSSMMVEAAPYIGYFVTNGLVLGLRPFGVGYEKPAGGKEVIKINTYFAPGYNFDLQSPVYPYVEGLIGWTSMSVPDVKGISYGGSVGAKMLLPNRGLLNFNVKYVMETLNASGATKRSGDNVLSASFGYSIWF